jgi:hypothetical protein
VAHQIHRCIVNSHDIQSQDEHVRDLCNKYQNFLSIPPQSELHQHSFKRGNGFPGHHLQDCGWLGFLSGSRAMMSSLLMVTWHGLSLIQPSEIMLSSPLLASTLNVKLGDEGGDASIPLFMSALTPVAQSFLQCWLQMTSLSGLCRHSRLRWLASQHCQNTDYPFLWCLDGGDHVTVRALVTSCSPTGAGPRWVTCLHPWAAASVLSISLHWQMHVWLPSGRSPQVTTCQGPGEPTVR